MLDALEADLLKMGGGDVEAEEDEASAEEGGGEIVSASSDESDSSSSSDASTVVAEVAHLDDARLKDALQLAEAELGSRAVRGDVSIYSTGDRRPSMDPVPHAVKTRPLRFAGRS